MAFDTHSNFAFGTVVTAPSPVTTGTVLVIGTTYFANFPDPGTSSPYDCVVWPGGTLPLSDNAEVIRVLSKGTNGTLNISRNAESSGTRSIAIGDQFGLNITSKSFTDIENTVGSLNSANLLRNSNFINNSTNGYGGTPDNVVASGTVVQGGFPAMSPALVQTWTGVSSTNCQGMWTCNGDFNDQSANGYNLTAVNTPTDSASGLMAQAKGVTISAANYASIANASCANIEISGNQTWISFFKPTANALGVQAHMMGKSNSTPSNYKRLFIESSANSIVFGCSGLTTNTQVLSNVHVEAGKWYMAVGVYDSSNSLLKIWVNGVKNQVTASGSMTSSGGDFAIGRLGAYTSASGNYFDGLLNGCAIYNVAFTDAQVLNLFKNTMYGGVKLNGAASATLSTIDSMLPALIGNNTTASVQMYQDTASTGKISVIDTATTSSATTATTGSYLPVSVTRSIASGTTAVTIQVASTSGNVWFKNVMYNQGSTALPWTPASEDWVRFPRLLRMDIPSMVGLKPYQYEENRLYTWTPTFSFAAGAAPTSPSTAIARASFSNKVCLCNISTIWGGAGTTVTRISATPPIKIGSTNSGYFIASAVISNSFSPVVGMLQNTNADANIDVYLSSSTVDRYGVNVSYEID